MWDGTYNVYAKDTVTNHFVYWDNIKASTRCSAIYKMFKKTEGWSSYIEFKKDFHSVKNIKVVDV